MSNFKRLFSFLNSLGHPGRTCRPVERIAALQPAGEAVWPSQGINRNDSHHRNVLSPTIGCKLGGGRAGNTRMAAVWNLWSLSSVRMTRRKLTEGIWGSDSGQASGQSCQMTDGSSPRSAVGWVRRGCSPRGEIRGRMSSDSDLQAWPEVPSIAHFCSLFRSVSC